MSERAGDFGEVRSLMQRAPDEAVWAALVEALDGFDAATLREAVIPYVTPYLSRWPDALRCAPPAWARRLTTQRDGTLWHLARAVDATTWHDAASPAELALHALTSAPEAPLTLLRLPRVEEAGAHAAEALRGWPGAPRLTLLGLHHATIEDDALWSLLHEGRWEALDTLELVGSAITDQLARALATAPVSRQLTALDLRRAGLHGASLQLVLAEGFPALEVLRLDGNALNGAARAMASRRALPRLAELTLSECELSASELARLLRAPFARTLRRLDLSQSWVGDEGARALIDASPRLPALRALDLTRTPISLDTMTALIEAMPQLDHLRIHRNQFSWANGSYLEDLCADQGILMERYLPPEQTWGAWQDAIEEW